MSGGGAAAVPQPPLVGPDWLAEIMDESGAAWCLLRHAPDAPAGGQDIDLLVAPAGHPAVAAALRRRGFVAQVTPGRGKERFFVRYDAADDAWPKIDIVTRLAYGPHKEIVTDLAPGVLRRRRCWPGAQPTPVAEDAFWLLLLHCLLDKQAVPERHRASLSALLPAAGHGDPSAGLLTASGVADAAPAVLLGRVAAGQWDAIEAVAPRLIAALRENQRPGAWWRRQRRRALRRVARSGLWPGAVLLVDVEGGDDASRARVREAVSTTAVPCRMHDEPRGRRRLDLVLALAPLPARRVPQPARRRVVLDPDLPPDELRRRAGEAVWAAYVERRSVQIRPR